MVLTNQMYNLFRDMKQAYANGHDDAVEQYARCWAQLAPENPFQYDTPEYEEFYQMQRAYMIWNRGDINAKINRRKMVEHAKALCALNPKQPYVYDKKAELLDKKEEMEKQNAIKEEIKEEKKVINEEPQTVLGVLPEEEEKEKKSWFKFLFPWKKDGE